PTFLSRSFQRSAALLNLHSFPTRRSSDLNLYYRNERSATGNRTVGTDRANPRGQPDGRDPGHGISLGITHGQACGRNGDVQHPLDRKSTRLNSSHVKISYAVFCLKKKKTK